MEESKKQVFMIAIVVVCLGFAGFIMYKQFGGGGGDGLAEAQHLVCTSCGATFEMSTKELQQQMADQPMMDPMMMSVPKYECKECGKKEAIIGMQCPQCEHVFIPNYNNTKDWYDRCPKCGYSEAEAAMKEE
ncbi:hypothetical protein SMSP2_02857 [Limihaloglobus sulfuriphilus]|uniref:Uncharacterized protein n=1 Tax=Limihaloglobus sulfuriphilus TaxID=1851148 RepID=A0A1Q2MJB0_9BACT|nr:hypothetical protein [Limihaloglobus sulfuriphilus]AQQ72472.1 hypothetical protein SMSP2_02857 [Limihaloglobus sulfuriphilus]